jgi:NADH-quinone oxidoreductase subunit C
MNIFTELPTNGGKTKSKHGDTWKSQMEVAKSKFATEIEEIRTPWDYPTDVPIFFVKKESVVPFLRYLREEPSFGYHFLADMTASDEGGNPRFEVIYNLYNPEKGPRIRVKTRVAENDSVPTLSGVWKGADWAEREIFDMFGIRFEGHPNLRRILMDYRWEGYPLRKDYPLDGYQLFPDAEPPDPERLK